MRLYVLIVTLFQFSELKRAPRLGVGELCVDRTTFAIGFCTKLSECYSFDDQTRQNVQPTLCSYSNDEAVICCLNNKLNTAPTTTTTSTTAIPTNLPISEPSRISEIKCKEYASLKLRKSEHNNHNRNTRSLELIGEDDDIDFVEPEVISRLTWKAEVLGGTSTDLHEFPHMAAVGWIQNDGNIKFKCGGSLISERFVLTAAHCAKLSYDTSIKDPEPKIVRLGEQDILESELDGADPIDINIIRIIKHPQYNGKVKYYDIALLKLERDVELDLNILPACLMNEDIVHIPKAVATGWGTTSSEDDLNSPNLQKVTLDVFPSSLCERLLSGIRSRQWPQLEDHQLCAGTLAGGKDSCQGDSGGPLQIKVVGQWGVPTSMYSIVGITSFGRGCGLRNYPGVYTKVSYFLDWIEKEVWINK